VAILPPFPPEYDNCKLQYSPAPPRSYPVPLAPLKEQEIIIDEIENLTIINEKTEQIVSDELKRSQSLRLSILKKAFEGKLVPQDPNDEPASVLLDKIKAEKAKLNN